MASANPQVVIGTGSIFFLWLEAG